MKDRALYIFTALDCIERIKEYIRDCDIETFKADRKTQDAVLRNLEVLGQCLKDYSIDDLVTDYPQIDWRALAGMRNIIAHDYLSIDIHIIWETLISHISPLEGIIQEIINEGHKKI